jgi:molybdopterin-containing oxidoreductase family iron-sulfur binding subunit
VARLDFNAARLVVSFSADFLDPYYGNQVPQQLDWADARAKGETAPRFVYVGPRRSLTGLNADEWIPARPGSELAVAQMLRGQLGVAAAAQQTGVSQAVLERLAQAVTAAGNGLLALAGGNTPNARELADAVNALRSRPAPWGAPSAPTRRTRRRRASPRSARCARSSTG